MLDAGCWILDTGCWMLDIRAIKFQYSEAASILISGISYPASGIQNFVLTLQAGKLPILNPTYHIKTEESIDPAEAVLLMTAGVNFFSYALMKHLSKEIVEFGYYTISNGQENSWADFFEDKEVLSERYHHSAISFNLAESILIPEEQYKAGETQPQLDF